MTLAQFIASKPLTGTPAEIAAAINALKQTVRRDFYVSYRTILGVVKSPAILEGIATYLRTSFPTTHAILLAVGKTDGEAGGLNNNVPETRAFYSILKAQVQGVTDDHVAALTALGTEEVPEVLLAVGLPSVTDQDVSAALEQP